MHSNLTPNTNKPLTNKGHRLSPIKRGKALGERSNCRMLHSLSHSDGQRTSQARNSLLLFLVALALSILITCCSCKSTADKEQKQVSKVVSDLVTDSLEQQLANSEPRQYFKVRVAPSQNKKRLPMKQTRSTNNEQKQQQLASQQNQSGEQQQPRSSFGKQKISNAALKKLLSQSLLRPLNETGAAGTGSSSVKTPNFKFVFIQRATVPPISSNESTSVGKKSGSTSKDGIGNLQHQSLAASVSKQLATSLLNSAASLVGNLSSVPSLSSLASQIGQTNQTGGKQVATNTISGGSTAADSSGSSPAPLPPSTEQDIRRIQSPADVVVAAKKSGLSLSGTKKSSGKSRPSKVYNLPVKFVSNGQPNHIVLNTIKQHFATIKKIQTVARLAGQSQQGKRRKQNGNQKFKGNSRLIYLPLKYLSNARPNRIISSNKATHKSTN